MPFKPELTTEQAVPNEVRLARYRQKLESVPGRRSLDAALADLDATFQRVQPKLQSNLTVSLSMLEHELDIYNRGLKPVEVPFEAAH